MKNIHPTALIDNTVTIEEDVSIGAYSVIEGNVKIGKGTVIHTHCVIKGNITIGTKNQIFQAASIGHPGQDLSFDNYDGKISIGNNNIIREYTSVHLPTKKENTTTIGNSNFIMSNCHVAHDAIIGNHCIMVQGAGVSGHVLVEDYAFISGYVGVHQFCRIGSYAMVGGISKVTLDIPPYFMCNGNPAEICGINRLGIRRAGFSSAEKNAVKDCYKILFFDSASAEDSVKVLEQELLPRYKDDEKAYQRIEHMIRFVKESKRGIAPHAGYSESEAVI